MLKYKPGDRVRNEPDNRRGTVVHKPHDYRVLDHATPVVIDGDVAVSWWYTEYLEKENDD